VRGKDNLPDEIVITGPPKIAEMIWLSEQGGADPWMDFGNSCGLRPRMLSLMCRYVLDMESFWPLDKFLSRAAIVRLRFFLDKQKGKSR